MVLTAALLRALGVSFTTLFPLANVLTAVQPVTPAPAGLRIEVTPAEGPIAMSNGQPSRRANARPGRLLVVLGRPEAREPRLSIGQTGKHAPPVLGRDVDGLLPGTSAVLDDYSAIFPLNHLRDLPPGAYAVQAVLHTNFDLNFPNAPGDLYSTARTVQLDPARGGTVRLELSQVVPDETLARDSELIRYIKIRSQLLSEFHRRPIYLRAGVILPRRFAHDPQGRYPVRVHIGGYGSRFTDVADMMSPGSSFHRLWMAADTPAMILIHLDGAGPLGDPYQVDSANHGPYGSAITRELIPHVEAKFRGVGHGSARVLDGGSTGGWVALALQVFYPDFFNGAWAFCPDSVDFRSFQLVNVYDDANAYVGPHGFERPAARDVSGDVRFTMRHECQLENVLGRGSSWTNSGGQWGAWNATYGPRGPDGRPVPLWDPATGAIDHEVAAHWKAFDLRHLLESRWSELGPKLKGKLHIWVGEADDYFLNHAVHRLDGFLSRARPSSEGSIVYGPGQGHCWLGIAQSTMMKQMAERLKAAPAAGAALAPSRK
jgi:hypothetical protein